MNIYEISEGRDFRYLDASICDDKICVSGQDMVPLVEKFFGDVEYEFWHEFSVEDTKKLKLLFHTDDLLVSLNEYFDGENRLPEFYELCLRNNIQYSTFSIWKEEIYG